MNTQTVASTLSSANQTAVPSIVRRLMEIQAGDRLLWEIEKEQKTIKVRRAPDKWGIYMRGLGKEVWSDTDANKYVKKLRRDRNI